VFIGPELACGISIGVVKEAARDWKKINDKKCRESVTGLIEAKGLAFTRALYQKNEVSVKIKQRWVVGLFTGHCHLKGHLFKL
jgi:hypothetical protein